MVITLKKSKLAISFFIGIAVGSLAAVGIYFMTAGDVVWQAYIENELIPNIVLALSAISALCVAAHPIINRLQASLKSFDQATSDVNATVENGKKTGEAIAAQDRKIEAFAERFDRMEKLFADGISSVRSTAENSEKILRIGFCNTEELVRKGYAAEIGKVGIKNEQDEKL